MKQLTLRQFSSNMVENNDISQNDFNFALYIYENLMWDKIKHIDIFADPNMLIADILHRTKNISIDKYRIFKGEKGECMRQRLDLMWYLSFHHLYPVRTPSTYIQDDRAI